MSNKNKSTVKKVVNFIINIVLFAFLVLCIITLVYTISLKKNGNDGANLFGHRALIVLSPSMEKCEQTNVSEYKIKSIKTNSMVYVENMPEEKDKQQEWLKNIKVGDVLTFKYFYSKQETITHRVVSISNNNGGYQFVLEGDNKNDNMGVLQQVIDTTDESKTNHIVGKVVGQSYFLGSFVTTLKSPVGIVCIIIVPSIIIIILEIIKLVNMYNSSKKQKEQDRKDKEIEELKKQLSIRKNEAENNEKIDN